MKVVKLWQLDCDDSGICQSPEFESSLESICTFPPASCARVWSMTGSWCLSVRTHLLSLVRSTQMCTLPLGLGTTTMLVHHSVGSDTFLMSPSFSMFSSSSFTFFIRGTAIWWRPTAQMVWLIFEGNGVVSLNWTIQGLQIRSGNCSCGLGCLQTLDKGVLDTGAISFRLLIARHPISGLLRPPTSYIASCACFDLFSVFHSTFLAFLVCRCLVLSAVCLVMTVLGVLAFSKFCQVSP